MAETWDQLAEFRQRKLPQKGRSDEADDEID
jgi:hypothetical protein